MRRRRSAKATESNQEDPSPAEKEKDIPTLWLKNDKKIPTLAEKQRDNQFGVSESEDD